MPHARGTLSDTYPRIGLMWYGRINVCHTLLCYREQGYPNNNLHTPPIVFRKQVEFPLTVGMSLPR